jgi:hypothetical protein
MRRVAGVQTRFDMALARHGPIVALPLERYDCERAG